MDNQFTSESEVILKLIKLTAEDRLKWTIDRVKKIGIPGDRYNTIYKDWKLSSYKVRILDQTSKVFIFRYRLSIMNVKSLKKMMLTENQQALKDLYQSIDNKASRLDDFFENILKE